MQSNRRGVSKTISAAAMILVGLFVGGVFYVGYASADSPATLQVQAFPSQIQSGDTAQIQVQIQHATPSTSYSVTIEVTPPTSPVNAGGPFCVTVFITTDGGGNGQVTVSYPDTGDPSALFQASACSPAGSGGPTTIVAGTYGVTVSTTGLASASTSFIVQPARHEVTGIGTQSLHSVATTTFYPAACPAGTTGPCYESCSGTPTTAPTSATAPYSTYLIGSVILTGVVSSVTPGVHVNHTVASSCSGTPSSPEVSTFTTVDTYREVTVNPPDAAPITGGLIVTTWGTSTYVVTSGTLGVFPYTLAVTSLDTWTFTGTGGLGGMSGTGEGVATTIVHAVSATDITLTTSSPYQANLTNVPGT